MTETAEHMKVAILKLSAEERAELASCLWDSLEDEEVATLSSETAFDSELQRRFEEMESGEDPGEPAEKVMRELREKHA